MRRKIRRTRRRFRMAGRIAARRALVSGDIDFQKYGEILIALSDDKRLDEMIAACSAQAVKCGLVTEDEVLAGGTHRRNDQPRSVRRPQRTAAPAIRREPRGGTG